MARTDGKAENQHYVPEMLLRNFAAPSAARQPQVHVFDKSDGRVFRTSTRNVASERNFYEADAGNGLTASIEQGLSDLEGRTKLAFERLVDERRLSVLTPEERAWISMFIATQYIRSKTFREMQLDLDAQMSEWFRRQGVNPENVKGWRPASGMDEAKILQMSFLSRKGKDLALVVAAKQWILLETDPARPFWISDNPVALHNDVPAPPPLGNIGFAAPGIQIYLPLSSTLLLGAWCFSLHEKIVGAMRTIERACASMREAWQRNPLYEPEVDDAIFAHVHGEKRAWNRSFMQAVDAGTPIQCTPENVVHFNWLQLRWAERQVYSSNDEFDLAREVLQKDPEFRKPPRMTIA